METVFSFLCATSLAAASAECFRALQATGYRPQRGYFKVCLSRYYLLLAAVQVAAVLVDVFVDFAYCVNAALFAVTALGLTLVKRKSPLKITTRLARMWAVQCVLLCALCVFVNAAYWVWLLPFIAAASWAICLPIDVAVNRRYIKLAQKKLFNSCVKVVAITGSYGKTSVKDMLSALLNDSLAPSGSCNTPLGIAAFINKTNLDNVRYLVLEFGARKRGDIALLCKLYKPNFGIVTGVCAQHLSTFKNIDNIVATKRELVECLPQDGFCVLNQSDGTAVQFENSGVCAKYMSRFGLTATAKKVDTNGTLLSVSCGEFTRQATLPQISDYVVDTFCMCSQMCLRLGQDFETTWANVGKIKPTPHRLQFIQGANIYILDDSYNGSVAGVESCCKTLAKFRCPKAVVTQGLVECGKSRREMNVYCGTLLGKVCDVAVVLGKNANYLAEGLRTTSCRVLFASSLNEAVRLATPFAYGGILLFQNDLPDSVGL